MQILSWLKIKRAKEREREAATGRKSKKRKKSHHDSLGSNFYSRHFITKAKIVKHLRCNEFLFCIADKDLCP